LTPTNFTILVEDTSGDVLETHGPYVNTAALYADTSSTLVTFAQSAGSGFTIQNPATLAATALTGGTDAGDLTDASAVTTLTGFSATLGPGTVALPGYTSSTAWTGLLAHASANNRFAAMDLTDSATASALVSSIGSIGTAANGSYGVFTSSTVISPGITPGTTRKIAGSAFVAALRAQVSRTGNDNQQPAGINWPLEWATGFTNTFTLTDMNTLNAAGINPWAVRFSTNCLFGFVTPVPSSSEAIFWEGNASTERMSLVNGATIAAEPYLFATIDGSQKVISNLKGALQGLIATHWSDGALYGATALDAGDVFTDPPVNLQVRISPAAQTVNIAIQFLPITQVVS
jgi:hypothetical protein